MAVSTNVCLIGPVSSGKSSLLATIKEAIDDGVHGYSPAIQFTINELPAQLSGPDTAFGRLKYRAGHFAEREQQFKRGMLAATLPDQTYKYHMNLKKLLERNPSDAETLSDIDLTIIDAAGELMFPDGGDTDGGDQFAKNVRNELIDLMEDSDAVVLVLKIILPESPIWKRDFTEIVDTVCAAKPRRLKRFVVAFNQYERLFVRFGGSAFQYATDPGIAAYALQQACSRADWLKPLQRLRKSGIDVGFVPTSPYGFVRNFGNPNLTMVNGAMERFEHNNPVSSLWRPFCSADPFIFAATGEASSLMFDADKMYGMPEKAPPGMSEPDVPAYEAVAMPPKAPQPANGGSGKKRSWLRALANTFNVNAGD